MKTLGASTAKERLQKHMNDKMRETEQISVLPEQKLACVVLKLAPAVTQDDYATLKTAIEAIAGIQAVSLVVDGQVPAAAEMPDNTEPVLYVSGHIRCNDVPEVE